MFSNVREADIFDACDLFVKGNIDKALLMFEEYYAVHPESISALNFIGDIYAMKGDGTKSEFIYQKLIDKLLDAEDYDKAIPIINKLKQITSDTDKPYRMLADVYSRKHRARISAFYLMDLADNLRHQGKFNECANVYTQIADEHRSNYKIISRVIHKLTTVGNFKVMASVLQKSVNSGILPPVEIDNFIQYMIDAECKFEYIAPFMLDFIRRNPDKFRIVENILIDMFRSNFNDELFYNIMSYVPLEETENFITVLMEYIQNRTVVMHMLKVASLGRDHDIIKGLVMRLYVDNWLDMNEIYKICLNEHNTIPMEEAVKIIKSEASVTDMIKYMSALRNLYEQDDLAIKAEKLGEYIDNKRVPKDISAFISDIEHYYEEPVQKNDPQDEASLENEMSAPVVEIITDAAEPVSVDVEPQHIDLSDDFGLGIISADETYSPIEGLESFVDSTEDVKPFSGFGDESANRENIADNGFFSDMPSPDAAETEHNEAETKTKKQDDFFSQEVDG